MLLQQAQIVLSGSTHKLYNKDKFLPSKAFGTVSFANLIFCLHLLINNIIPSKTATLWRCLSNNHKKKRKTQVRRHKVGQNLLLFSAPTLICSQCFLNIILLFWTVSSLHKFWVYLSLRLSCYRRPDYRMSSKKNNLVNSLPAQRHFKSIMYLDLSYIQMSSSAAPLP